MACWGPSDGKVAAAAACLLRGLGQGLPLSRRAAETGTLREYPHWRDLTAAGTLGADRSGGAPPGSWPGRREFGRCGGGSARPRSEPSRLGSRGRGSPSPQQLPSFGQTPAARAQPPATCLYSPPTPSSRTWVSAGPWPWAAVCRARKVGGGDSRD